MAAVMKARTWQRAASGLLAVGGAWAVTDRVVSGEVQSWLQVLVAVGSLYGVYLFAYFAWRGRMAGTPRPAARVDANRGVSSRDV